MQNFSDGLHARAIREEGAIYSATGAGRIGFVSADDIAAAAVVALTAELPLNADVLLTGPEALSYGEVATLLSELLPRPVRHVHLETAELTQRFLVQGLPRDYAETLSRLDESLRAGVEDRTTDGVASLTGRAPTSFRDFARQIAGRLG
jgi:uncharacterized protein YbjT (DUF2867 family)